MDPLTIDVNTVEIFILFLCLIFSAFFSASETAVTTVGTLKASHLLESGDKRAIHLKLWIKDPSAVLSTILIFNNTANITASAIATDLASRYFESKAIGIATGIMTFIVVIFCEVLPKAYAKTHAVSVAPKAMRIITLLYMTTYPLIRAVSILAEKTVKAFSNKDLPERPPITEDEIEYMVKIGEKTGVIETVKHSMLSGVFEFDDTKVREIMTPRTDMVAIEVTTSFTDALKVAIETGYSRIPVYKESTDHIVGILLTKDLLNFAEASQKNQDSFSLKAIARRALFFPESRTVSEAFKSLKKFKQHVAIVVDEYGGTAGLVTLEDIVEVIVGEIQDETDEELEKIIELGNNTYDISGTINIDEFLDYFDLNKDVIEELEDGDIDTLSGLLTKKTQSMPKIGQVISFDFLKVEVTQVHRHRVERVKITLTPEESLEQDGVSKVVNVTS